jgi:hypothetical protein
LEIRLELQLVFIANSRRTSLIIVPRDTSEHVRVATGDCEAGTLFQRFLEAGEIALVRRRFYAFLAAFYVSLSRPEKAYQRGQTQQ